MRQSWLSLNLDTYTSQCLINNLDPSRSMGKWWVGSFFSFSERSSRHQLLRLGGQYTTDPLSFETAYGYYKSECHYNCGFNNEIMERCYLHPRVNRKNQLCQRSEGQFVKEKEGVRGALSENVWTHLHFRVCTSYYSLLKLSSKYFAFFLGLKLAIIRN